MTRRKLREGDPVAPVQQLVSAGIHERDLYIAAALASCVNSWSSETDSWMLTPQAIADRACRIADATMERKESQ